MPDPAKRAQDERGDDRILAPPCPNCQTDERVTVVSRTEYVVYFRCAECGHTESIRKPTWNP